MSINVSEPLVIDKDNPKNYTSIYGYPKLGFHVYRSSDTNKSSPVGFIKQEPQLDESGKVAGFTYYTRTSWRNPGQPRFFASPEALLKAYGGTLARKTGLVKKPRLAEATPKKRAVAKPVKKRRLKKVAA